MSEAKRMLADVLWEAANERLGHATPFRDSEKFSCHAAMCAELGPNWRSRRESDSRAVTFLSEIGCNPRHAGFPEDIDWTIRDLQGARYMWLLLAMHVAEDEGIEL